MILIMCLQDQKFNNLVIDPGTARNFERPFKPHLEADDQHAEQNSSNGQASSKSQRTDKEVNSVESSSISKAKQTPLHDLRLPYTRKIPV